jgi:hypothetical protein
MSLSDDLLKVARELAVQGKTKPKQATLRRAVSTAYYALFHLLSDDASQMTVRNKRLRLIVRRAFRHSDMVNASRSFQGGTLPKHLSNVLSEQVSSSLRLVAAAFVDLQQARHEADYDLSKRFIRSDVNASVEQAANAFELWKTKGKG